MTIWYDFTTSLRNVTGRNGIAAVEWSVGEALLAARPDVRAFALSGRHLAEVDVAVHLSRVLYATDDVPPSPTPLTSTWRDGVRAALRRSLGPRSVPVIRALSTAYQAPRRLAGQLRERERRGPPPVRLTEVVESGDVVISLGADWEGDVAKRLIELRRTAGCKVVTMVHDLIPLTHPHLAFANEPSLFVRYYEGLLAASDLIVCNSDQSQRDLHEFARRRNLVTPLTKMLHLGEVADGARLEAGVRREGFYLWVGTVEARKNLELLYDALRILDSEGAPLPSIVVAGATGWGVGNLIHELSLRATPAARALVMLGPVDVDTLEGLYERARALLFPSYYEGWGLPVREAAIRGCPVAAGECSAIREALDGFDGATFLSPDDPDPWATFLREGPRAATSLEAHAWSATAQQLLEYAGSL